MFEITCTPIRTLKQCREDLVVLLDLLQEQVGHVHPTWYTQAATATAPALAKGVARLARALCMPGEATLQDLFWDLFEDLEDQDLVNKDWSKEEFISLDLTALAEGEIKELKM